MIKSQQRGVDITDIHTQIAYQETMIGTLRKKDWQRGAMQLTMYHTERKTYHTKPANEKGNKPPSIQYLHPLDARSHTRVTSMKTTSQTAMETDSPKTNSL